MSTIEKSLREMFTARVQTPPPVSDLAGTAIRRGRAARLRRTSGSTLAAALAFLLTIGGVVSFRGWEQLGGVDRGPVPGFNAGPLPWDPAPTTAPPQSVVASGVGLDIRAGDRLWTTDGRLLRLTGVTPITRIYRVPDGWVYGGSGQVRLLRTDGSSIALSGEDGRWALSSDGTRIAFAVGGMLYLARLTASGMAVQDSAPIPEGSSPVTLLDDDQVVIRAASAGFDVIDPARSTPVSWNTRVTAVLGGQGDRLVGLVRSERGSSVCLAELRTGDDGLRVGRTGGCAATLEDVPERLDPAGSWLARPDTEGVTMVEVSRVLQGRPTAVTCPVHPSVAPLWSDERTVVTADDQRLVRCRTDGGHQVLPLPGGVPTGWELVPRRGRVSDGGS